jgi:hypothetical protein
MEELNLHILEREERERVVKCHRQRDASAHHLVATGQVSAKENSKRSAKKNVFLTVNVRFMASVTRGDRKRAHMFMCRKRWKIGEKTRDRFSKSRVGKSNGAIFIFIFFNAFILWNNEAVVHYT